MARAGGCAVVFAGNEVSQTVAVSRMIRPYAILRVLESLWVAEERGAVMCM